MSICEKCNQEHDSSYGSGRFCSCKCARSFATKEKRQEINRKVSETVRKKYDKIGRVSRPLPYKRRIPCKGCGTLDIKKHKQYCENCQIKYYLIYRVACSFTFNIFDYPDKFDLSIINSVGLYSPSNRQNNLFGISKDHMFSIHDAFIIAADPKIISHPANCTLMPHIENQKKKNKSTITFEELLERIKRW